MRSILAMVLSLLVMSPLHARTIDVYENNNSPPFYASASDIQMAIDIASPGDVVVVHPGTYASTGNRNIDFRGKQFYLSKLLITTLISQLHYSHISNITTISIPRHTLVFFEKQL